MKSGPAEAEPPSIQGLNGNGPSPRLSALEDMLVKIRVTP
jgi:hypothetical protein